MDYIEWSIGVWGGTSFYFKWTSIILVFVTCFIQLNVIPDFRFQFWKEESVGNLLVILPNSSMGAIMSLLNNEVLFLWRSQIYPKFLCKKYFELFCFSKVIFVYYLNQIHETFWTINAVYPFQVHVIFKHVVNNRGSENQSSDCSSIYSREHLLVIIRFIRTYFQNNLVRKSIKRHFGAFYVFGVICVR